MRKAAVSESRIDLPNIDTALLQQPDAQRLMAPERATHAPRFLLLYGSLRERSFSRLAVEEAVRILSALGGETRMFNPSGLPLVDDAPHDHPKVRDSRPACWACCASWSSPPEFLAQLGHRGRLACLGLGTAGVAAPANLGQPVLRLDPCLFDGQFPVKPQ